MRVGGCELFFSIIMPVYNAEDFLKDSLSSIISQDFGDYECILIDDGSKDRSFAIMQEYAGKSQKIRVFTQENHGPAYARNVGISKARGEYLLFIDCDDCYIPGTLKTLYSQLVTDRPDVLCFGYEETDGEQKSKKYAINETLFYKNKIDVEENFVDIMEKRILIASTCNKAYARKMILENQLKLPEDVYLAEDLSFNVSVLEHADSYKFIPNVCYRYIHRNTTSIIKRFKKDKFEQLLKCHVKRSTALKKYSNQRKDIEMLICMDYIRICFSCFMDLVLKDCPWSTKEKLDYIERIVKESPFTTQENLIRSLRWKERIIYRVFATKNKYVLYLVSILCFYLKFYMGMSF